MIKFNEEVQKIHMEFKFSKKCQILCKLYFKKLPKIFLTKSCIT